MFEWTINQTHFNEIGRKTLILGGKAMLNVVIVNLNRRMRCNLILWIYTSTTAPGKKFWIFFDIINQSKHLAC